MKIGLQALHQQFRAKLYQLVYHCAYAVIRVCEPNLTLQQRPPKIEN